MKKQPKQTVEVSKAETPATKINVNGAKAETQNHSLILVKPKLTVAEKLDKIQSFDAIHGRYDYLSDKKRQLDQFAKSQNGFLGAELELADSEGNSVKISNPLIVEELVKLARTKCNDLLMQTEVEIAQFEIH